MAAYYVNDRQGERGPFTSAQLRTMWDRGAITADAQCRAADSDFWADIAPMMEVRPASPPAIQAVQPPLMQPTKEKKKKSGCATLFIVSLVILLVIVVISAFTGNQPGVGRTSKTLNIEVGWGSDFIHIKNVGSADVGGKPITVYLNGMPPFSYKADWPAPVLGETAQIPLTVFVKGDSRFDPKTQAVKEAWIGGAAYDYVRFQ